MQLKTLPLRDVKKGTRIFMRVDCNVPVKSRSVEGASAWRLERTLDDIQKYLKKGAIVVLAGHLGRPGGVHKLSLSLRPIARWYEAKLGVPVHFIKDVPSAKSIQAVKKLQPGSLVMLENLRFYPNEEFNCIWFARRLSKYADVYVNNAFGVCHRRHASVKQITRFLPSFAGSILVEEVKYLGKKQAHPFSLVLGGVKLKTKMPTLMHLGKRADTILLGGGVSIALESVKQKKKLQLKGKPIDRRELTLARKALKAFQEKFVLPVDYMCKRDGKMVCVDAGDLQPTDEILDIGKRTRKEFAKILKSATSVVFNGAMGSLQPGAEKGTVAVAKVLPLRAKKHTIVGGGDTVGFLQKQKLLKHFSFVSTGGGAMLTFLAGASLPGLKPLKK